MTREENIEYIRNSLTMGDLWEQLAEEASELAQAASKMARFYNNRNTPAKDYDELVDNVIEERSDIATIFEVLQWEDKEKCEKISDEKLERWANRLRGHFSWCNRAGNCEPGRSKEHGDIWYEHSKDPKDIIGKVCPDEFDGKHANTIRININFDI